MQTLCKSIISTKHTKRHLLVPYHVVQKNCHCMIFILHIINFNEHFVFTFLLFSFLLSSFPSLIVLCLHIYHDSSYHCRGRLLELRHNSLSHYWFYHPLKAPLIAPSPICSELILTTTISALIGLLSRFSYSLYHFFFDNFWNFACIEKICIVLKYIVITLKLFVLIIFLTYATSITYKFKRDVNIWL